MCLPELLDELVAVDIAGRETVPDRREAQGGGQMGFVYTHAWAVSFPVFMDDAMVFCVTSSCKRHTPFARSRKGRLRRNLVAAKSIQIRFRLRRKPRPLPCSSPNKII